MPSGKRTLRTTTKKTDVDFEKKQETFECTCCHESKAHTEFYRSKNSPFWNTQDKTVCFCKECVKAQFEKDSNNYGIEKACIFACYRLDIPWIPSVFETVKAQVIPFDIGRYYGSVGLSAYSQKSFANSILNNEFAKGDDEIKDEIVSTWSKQDNRNRNFAITIAGFDPFDEAGMSNSDRKYCYNVLASYFDTPGISEDGHKIQAAIQMTNNLLQIRKIDEFLNKGNLRKVIDAGGQGNLVSAKKQLQDIISKIAKDNNFSSEYRRDNSAGVNTLSGKMKELAQNDYEAIKVNLFDIKTSEAMRQVADLSNKSILEQLSLDATDYTQMLKEQREMITEYSNKNDELLEENRQLKNALEELKNTTKSKRKVGV